MVAKNRVAAAAVWACCAAAVAGVAYQSSAEATVRPDALQCNEGEFVISTIFEADLTQPGAATPDAALEGLQSAYPAENTAAMQAVERADDHAVFARSEAGKQRFVAKLVDNGGWRIDAAAACVTGQRGGRS